MSCYLTDMKRSGARESQKFRDELGISLKKPDGMGNDTTNKCLRSDTTCCSSKIT
jgi:hypothetical protein